MTAQRISSLPGFGIRLLSPQHWLTWLFVLLFFLFTRLPLSVTDPVARGLGLLIYRNNKKRLHYACVNMRLCFLDKHRSEIEQMAKEHFQYHMMSMMHYGILWWSSRARVSRMIEIQGSEHIDEARRQGKQVIALTSHSVGLEFAVAALSMSYPSSGPYKSMKNALVDWLVARGRTRFGVRAYTREDGMRPIIRDTRNGNVMIYLADEDLGADRSVFASFFGVQKATIPILGRLAKQCDAVVLPCVSCYDREKKRYIVHISPPIEGLQEEHETSARVMNQAIEQTVLRCLSQYLWTLRLFKTRPEGEDSVYG